MRRTSGVTFASIVGRKDATYYYTKRLFRPGRWSMECRGCGADETCTDSAAAYVATRDHECPVAVAASNERDQN